MLDRLTIIEEAQAEEQGWRLVDVYDVGTARWMVEAMPCSHPQVSVRQTMLTLTSRAREGDRLAIRAMQVISTSHRSKTRKKK